MPELSVQQVFPTVGKPTITYVERDNGELERRLKGSLETPGQICLITGPSKLGKTSLYQRVLPLLKRQAIVIRCSSQLSARNFWATALERLDFSQVAEQSKAWGLTTQTDIGIKGEVGWAWLAKLAPSLNFSIQGKTDEEIKRQFATSELSAAHLIPLLRGMPLQLVVEDFHYLSENTKKEIFQQWKAFVDEGVSVLVVSTNHHSTEIFSSNSDLRGRTRNIDVGHWQSADLAKIVQTGMDHFRLKNGQAIRSYIARESMGVPIITQQICQEFVSGLDLSTYSQDVRKNYHPDHVKPSILHVAKEFYGSFDGDFERLSQGPRAASRKYATYELILGAFVAEPLKFSLSKSELVTRISSLCGAGENVPTASINSSLNALSKLQKDMGGALIEWQSQKQMLHVIEPTFLFYLRQKLRDRQLNDSTQIDLFDKILQDGDITFIRERVIRGHAGRVFRSDNR